MSDDAADGADPAEKRADETRDAGREQDGADRDGQFDFDAAEAPADGAGAEASSAEETEGHPGDDLANRVAEYDEELAREVLDLGDRVAELESELAAVDDRLQDREERVAELENSLKRKQADFQNYKKRTKKKQAQIKERATEDFVSQVVKVRDNLVRALDQDADADIRGGLESTLSEFDRLLESENVEVIEPEPGTETDPQRHEVMMRVDSDQPEGTVEDVYQPGYEMADKVIRAAQVTVSKGDEE
ncbi:nucleotide exchange factor GrpE [Halobium salinum]|uniref:Protein GrpE n=1 Tax=Halobium salinum TaxID=1364940 RepID=A0ABD5P698_9EURY|nr:nucleotide exchange factor GrpE [Halobium salinum]